MDSILIRLQKVGPLLFVELESNGGAAVGDVRQKLLTNICLDFLRYLWFLPADPPDVCGNSNPFATRVSRKSLPGEHIFHALRAHPPLGDKSVRRKSGMQRTGSASIKIWNVVAYDGAETLDIEVCVFELQRVERPFDQIY